MVDLAQWQMADCGMEVWEGTRDVGVILAEELPKTEPAGWKRFYL